MNMQVDLVCMAKYIHDTVNQAVIVPTFRMM